MITITLAQLTAARACLSQRVKFKARYGASASWPTPEAFEADCVAQVADWDWCWAAANLLLPDVLNDFDRQRDAAWADYERRRAPLRAEYARQYAALCAKYDRQRDALYEDYRRQSAPVRADYDRQRNALWADHEREYCTAAADYDRQRLALWDDYARQRAALFARLYAAQTSQTQES